MKRSEIIRELVKEKGWSLRFFSDKIGIPPTTFISMLDRGIGNSSVDSVMKICKGLGITVEELYERAGLCESKKDEPILKAAHTEGEETEEELRMRKIAANEFRKQMEEYEKKHGIDKE